MKAIFYGGKEHEVSIEVAKLENHYWIDVVANGQHITEYFCRQRVAANTRLRSPKSIEAEYIALKERVGELVEEHAHEVIVDSGVEVSASIKGSSVYFDSVALYGTSFLPACNLKSAESGQVLAWHAHDVFKQGPIVLTASLDEGQLRLSAPDAALYDVDKMRALVDSENFQTRKFAFFKYEEALRIAGMEHGSVKEMSGLFPMGRAK